MIIEMLLLITALIQFALGLIVVLLCVEYRNRVKTKSAKHWLNMIFAVSAGIVVLRISDFSLELSDAVKELSTSFLMTLLLIAAALAVKSLTREPAPTS